MPLGWGAIGKEIMERKEMLIKALSWSLEELGEEKLKSVSWWCSKEAHVTAERSLEAVSLEQSRNQFTMLS